MIDSIISIATTTIILGLIAAAVVVVNLLTRALDSEKGRKANDIILNSRVRKMPWFAIATTASTITPLYAIFTTFALEPYFFGIFILMSPLSLVLAGYLSRHLTKLVIKRHEDRPDRNIYKTGLIGSIFYNEEDKSLASLCRLIGLGNVLIIIWLEVKYLSIYVSSYLTPGSAESSPFVVGLIAAIFVGAMSLFVIKFKMNGVIISDCIYWPVTLFAVFVLAGCISYLLIEGNNGVGFDMLAESIKPRVPALTLLGFMFNVLLINIAVVSVRDEHWIRVTAFSETDGNSNNLMVELLPKACIQAAVLWFLLIVIGGLLFPAYASGNPGDLSRFDRILIIAEEFPVLFSFVIAGIFAIALSTLDSQFFTFRQLLKFDPVGNRLIQTKGSIGRYFRNATFAALAAFFSITGALLFDIDDSAFIFVFYGLPVVLLPGMLKICFLNIKVTSLDLLVPLFTYLVVILLGIGIKISSGEAPLAILMWGAPISLLVGLFFVLVVERQFYETTERQGG